MIRSTKGALEKPISGVQIRAARSLLGWTRQELAKRAVISDASLYALESARDTPGNAAALTAVRAVLEAAGIELLVDGNAPECACTPSQGRQRSQEMKTAAGRIADKKLPADYAAREFASGRKSEAPASCRSAGQDRRPNGTAPPTPKDHQS
jgi:transcriptional regulator with XRE-family HTH domain